MVYIVMFETAALVLVCGLWWMEHRDRNWWKEQAEDYRDRLMKYLTDLSQITLR